MVRDCCNRSDIFNLVGFAASRANWNSSLRRHGTKEDCRSELHQRGRSDGFVWMAEDRDQNTTLATRLRRISSDRLKVCNAVRPSDVRLSGRCFAHGQPAFR